MSRHDLSVGSRDLDTGVQAGLVVSLDDVSAVNLSGTNTTVVWALGTGETVKWPSIWSVREIEQGVLLLKTEPWHVGLVCLGEPCSLVAVVVLVWGSVGIPALGQDQNVGGATKRVGEDCDRSEVDIRVVTRGLSS